jgi:hypothetical protein
VTNTLYNRGLAAWPRPHAPRQIKNLSRGQVNRNFKAKIRDNLFFFQAVVCSHSTARRRNNLLNRHDARSKGKPPLVSQTPTCYPQLDLTKLLFFMNPNIWVTFLASGSGVLVKRITDLTVIYIYISSYFNGRRSKNKVISAS